MARRIVPVPKTVVHPIEPLFSDKSRVLILGTMPSPKSREEGFYYAHSQNRFWKVMAALFKSSAPKSIEEKKALILENGLALFDVLRSCEISGASDATIKNPEANDLSPILSASKIDCIVTNGQKATELYLKHTYEKTKILPVALPSTSPQNFKYSLDSLIEEYSIIKTLLKR